MFCLSLLLNGRALLSTPIFSGKYRSKLHTLDGVYYSELTPRELLRRACIYGFSTIEGREQATRVLLNYCRKTPFILQQNVAVVPTTSPTNPECIFIFSHHFEVEKIGKKLCKVHLLDGTIVEVPVSHHTLVRQRERMFITLHYSKGIVGQKQFFAYIKRTKKER